MSQTFQIFQQMKKYPTCHRITVLIKIIFFQLVFHDRKKLGHLKKNFNYILSFTKYSTYIYFNNQLEIFLPLTYNGKQ